MIAGQVGGWLFGTCSRPTTVCRITTGWHTPSASTRLRCNRSRSSPLRYAILQGLKGAKVGGSVDVGYN